MISMFVDPFFGKLSRLVPQFAVDGVDYFLKLLFHILRAMRIIRLSRDSEKATTLRSKVIWAEALNRGIHMEQIVVFGKYTDNYRAKVQGKYIYFDSLPLPHRPLNDNEEWDDKFYMKKVFAGENIPIPACHSLPIFKKDRRKIFDKLQKPVIVKPRKGSRGRHTTTNIEAWDEFEKAYQRAKVLSPEVVGEEHLKGYVCRATCVAGKLAGFYRAEQASITGDGKKSIIELIDEKNKNRPERVSEIKFTDEINESIKRLGFKKEDVLPMGTKVELSHRTGRLFGGITKEMLDELHPSFVPVLEKAAQATTLSVVGMDCIIPNPEHPEDSQRWGIIECNTLPFIDLHYYALDGKPKNIAGMIWDLWK
ncbi:MAG TPA: hypothetical protein VFQ59_00405 [Candidatus Paceibacterota bacterium]|nr:hypothetical protein [Candidatus Paceibacterota bacterium]